MLNHNRTCFLFFALVKLIKRNIYGDWRGMKIKEEAISRRNHTGWILFTLITVSVLIRYLICGYTKTVAVYPDEMRYISMARSFVKYGERLYLNLPYAYENLLYPILLMPAALISDKVLQLKMMALSNCVFLSLGVIPVYLLAKKCTKSKKSVWLACIIYLVSSDFAYSCTFLRENLYLPLSVWVFYVLFIELENIDAGVINKKTIGTSILFGSLVWLLFFCKRTCFPLMAALVLYPFLKWIKNKIRHQNAVIHWQSLVNILFCLIGFFVPYFILDYTVFAADHVNQLDFRKAFESIDLYFGYYYFIYYILILFLAYTFYPFLVTFNERHNISSSTRHLYYITLLSLLMTAFWVATNTNLGEDWGKTLPRIHLRYLMIHYIPLIICMLAALESEGKSEKKKWLIGIPIGLTAWYAYYLLLSDHLIVGDWDLLQETPLAYFAMAGTKGQTIDWLIFSTVSLTAMFLYYKGNKKYKTVMLSMVIGLNVLNGGLASIVYWPAHNKISQKEADSVEEVSDFIEQHSDKTFVVFTGDNKNKELWHTYIDEPNVLWLDYSQFNAYVSGLDENDDRSWKTASKNVTNYYIHEYYQFDHVDYIIWPSTMTVMEDVIIDDMLEFDESDGTYSEINDDACAFALKNTKEIPEITFGIMMLSADEDN